MACASVPAQTAIAPLAEDVLTEASEPGLDRSQAMEVGLARLAAEKRAEVWLKENAEAIESSNAFVVQRGIPLETYRKF